VFRRPRLRAIEQAAMAAFMRNGGFEQHLRKAAVELRRRRGALLSGLLLGFASLSSAQIRVATHLLGESLAAAKAVAGLP